MRRIIGRCGFGTIIFEGLAAKNTIKILSGAVPAILIALGMDLIFAAIERQVTPKDVMG